MRAQSSFCSGFGSKKQWGRSGVAARDHRSRREMVSLKGRGRKSKWTRGKYGLLWYALVPMQRLDRLSGPERLRSERRKRGQAPPLKAFRHPRHGSNGAGRDQWITCTEKLAGTWVKTYPSRAMASVSRLPGILRILLFLSPFRQGESLCIFTNLFRWKFDHS